MFFHLNLSYVHTIEKELLESLFLKMAMLKLKNNLSVLYMNLIIYFLLPKSSIEN
jgi:hypothetical protein